MTTTCKRLSANECARRFFVKAMSDKRTEVSNIELQMAVAKRTGQSRATVSGTLDTTGAGTLLESPWYTANWHKEKRGHYVVHVRNRKGVRTSAPKLWDYDTEAKHDACRRIMAYLPETGMSRLLTLACCHGNCVQAAVARNKYTVIDNIEKRRDVLTAWKVYKRRHDLASRDYLGSLEEFVQEAFFARTSYDVINADAMGYAGETMYSYLSVINRLKNTRILALTTQQMAWFRNHGAEADRLRQHYTNADGSRVPDAHAKAIIAWLYNYKLIDRWGYRSGEKHDTMEVFIFERKD